MARRMRTPRSRWALRPTALAVVGLWAAGCHDYEVARPMVQEAWEQPARESGVDILWVIDDSASMSEEQEQLLLHSESFISFLSNAAVDFRIALTTTDLGRDGAGQPLGGVMSADTPELAIEFARTIEAIPSGDRDERGFEAALALLEQQGTDTVPLRRAADLEVIFFSDEDDHSDLTVQQYLNQVDALRPDALVAHNAVVGDLPEGCASLLAAADPGDRYVEAQLATEGLRESICSADYSALLERIALKVLGLENRFALREVPDPTTLEVRVDGALIPQRERHGWTWDAGTNIVSLDGYAVPAPGSTVDIRYYQWMGSLDVLEDQQSAEEGE